MPKQFFPISKTLHEIARPFSTFLVLFNLKFNPTDRLQQVFCKCSIATFMSFKSPSSSYLEFLGLKHITLKKREAKSCWSRLQKQRSSEWKRGWFKEWGNPQPSGPRLIFMGKLGIYIVLIRVSLLCGIPVSCTVLWACADCSAINHSKLNTFIALLFHIFLLSFIFCLVFLYQYPLKY